MKQSETRSYTRLARPFLLHIMLEVEVETLTPLNVSHSRTISHSLHCGLASVFFSLPRLMRLFRRLPLKKGVQVAFP